VPYVRGRERSLPAEVLLDEVQRLAAEGYRRSSISDRRSTPTAMTTSISPSCCGARPVPGSLGAVHVATPVGHDRCRHCHDGGRPEGVSAVAPAGAVGSDRVLERMERGYTRAEYLELSATCGASCRGSR